MGQWIDEYVFEVVILFAWKVLGFLKGISPHVGGASVAVAIVAVIIIGRWSRSLFIAVMGAPREVL